MEAQSNARAQFQAMVEDHGAALRNLSTEELLSAGDEPSVKVKIHGRRGTIANIVEQLDDGDLRVVVQGLLNWRILPFVCDVELDGFYKRANGEVEPLADDEYYEFD